MEKTARRPSQDPTQERLRQNKANWNKDVSTFVNDLIHFKKMMNGWPSKFFKERSRIVDPIPADPATVIGSLAGDFQELAQRGNSIIQEQINYSKNRRKKQPKQLNLPLPQQPGQPPSAPEAPKAPEQDLSKQLSLGLNASEEENGLFKIASVMEEKYSLEAEGSNPLTRFLARLKNPRIGFGEAARMRRLRMDMLADCAKTLRALKQVQSRVVKYFDDKNVKPIWELMTSAWNAWSSVNNITATFKKIGPHSLKETGGPIDDPDQKRQQAIEEGRDPEEPDNVAPTPPPPPPAEENNSELKSALQDYGTYNNYIGAISKNPQFGALVSSIERLKALPKTKKPSPKALSDLLITYNIAVGATNQELGTTGKSLQEIVQQHQSMPKKEAQEAGAYLRSLLHKGLSRGTSGKRLEIYNSIVEVKEDLDQLMNLLEAGYDRQKIEPLVQKIHGRMVLIRRTIRGLIMSVDPKNAPPAFF